MYIATVLALKRLKESSASAGRAPAAAAGAVAAPGGGLEASHLHGGLCLARSPRRAARGLALRGEAPLSLLRGQMALRQAFRDLALLHHPDKGLESCDETLLGPN